MRLIIIPANEVVFFTGATSPSTGLMPFEVGDYPHVLNADVLADPAHQAFFQQRRAEGHNIWLFEQVDYSKWGAFTAALMTSSVGQRVMAAAPTNVYASFAAALAASNAPNTNAILSTVAAVYQLTNQEKQEFNALVDKYGVELTKFEGV